VKHLLLLLAIMPMFGCDSLTSFAMLGHDMTITSSGLESPVELTGDFSTAVYNYEDPNTLDVILIDGPEDNPRQAVHIQMYWKPRAGLTPLDDSATNAAVRYAIFEGDQIALYGGGGMLRPGGTPGKDDFRASLVNASLRLMDAGEGAQGPVGFIALAEGSFTAKRDDLRTAELVRKIELKLKEELGYPRFIGSVERAHPLVSR